MSDTAMVDVPTASNGTPTTTTAGTKRKHEEETSATQPAGAGASAVAAASNGEPSEKKQKTESGAAGTSSDATAAAAVTNTSLAPPAKPAASPSSASSSSSSLPKQTGTAPILPKSIPKKSGAAPVAPTGKPISLAKGPVSLAKKPLSTPTKPTAVGAKPAGSPSSSTAAKPAAAAAASSSSATKPKLLTKVKSEKKGDDSDTSSSDEDDEPLIAKKAPVKKAASSAVKEEKKEPSSPKAASASSSKAEPSSPTTKKQPARKASTPKKKADSSSDSSDSDSDSDSDSSDSSDSDSSDSDDSSDVSDSSDSSASDSSRKKKKKKAPVKRKPPAKKKAPGSPKAGGAATKYSKKNKTKRPKADGEESGSESSEDEGYDETKVILYPMDKYDVRSDVVPLKESQGANKWWNRLRAPGDKTKWTTLEHNGILFPAEYVPHNIPMLYDGAEVKLTPAQEEVASMWATMLDTAEAHTSNPTFAKNFFRDFRAQFPKDTIIKDFAKCDFTTMRKHLTNERETAKLVKKTDKKAKAREKEEKDILQATYGFALVDGYKEKVGNFRVEPPGLFRGRGDHPKTGTLKKRVVPEQIIINISPGMPIPKPPAGHKWKGIIHNNKVTWLAFYRDNVNGDFKYIWLAPSSRFKGESDIKKYTKAQKLKKYIDEIRKNYKQEMSSQHSQFRQRATAIYLIDFLALRVGNEKDKNEVADTVGCCSLRVEHLTFTKPNKVTFDFLGKDSMRYFNTVELDEKAYKNLESFTKGKKPKEEVFDNLSTTLLNEHLKSLMPELTAKVFRTYNASVTLEKELHNPEKDIDVSEHPTQKLNFYNAANREVSILCNHQRSIPKGHAAAVGKLQDQIDSLNEDKEELEDLMEEMQEKKANKADKAARAEREEARDAKRQARLEAARQVAKEKWEKEKAARAKLRAAGKEVDTEEEPDDDWGVKEKPRTKPTDLKKAQAALTKLEERILNYNAKLALRDENKAVALGTAKINYMDPRITVAWCKAKDVPLESVFSRALVTKFPWAMEVPPDWRF